MPQEDMMEQLRKLIARQAEIRQKMSQAAQDLQREKEAAARQAAAQRAQQRRK